MVLLLGLAAAIMLAGGYVLQQHEASRAAGELLTPRLLLVLARRPIWLGGIGAMVVGQLLGATALGVGSVVVVEPLLATNVLFALPLGALWSHRRLGRGEWLGAALLVTGLALLFAGAAPPDGVQTQRIAAWAWLISGSGVVAATLLLVGLARRRGPVGEATLLATAAGVLFGLQDVLTQRVLQTLSSGLVAVLTSWPPLGAARRRAGRPRALAERVRARAAERLASGPHPCGANLWHPACHPAPGPAGA